MPALPMVISVSQPSEIGVPGPAPPPSSTSLQNGALLARGSRPEITPPDGGITGPPPAMPILGSIEAIARCTAHVTLSPTLVVATEVDVGWRGMPPTLPS